MSGLPPAVPRDIRDPAATRVIEAAAQRLGTAAPRPGGTTMASTGAAGTLAIVLETEGSTYARAGALVLFAPARQVGWLSGGCLEPEIEQRAHAAATQARLDWIEIDTRDDAALFSGNAVGCRGRQRVALLPLDALPGIGAVFEAWLAGHGPLQLALSAGGGVDVECDGRRSHHALHTTAPPWPPACDGWVLRWMPPPRAVLLGAGPEAAPLVGTLAGLGWQARVLDRRPAWRARSTVAVDDAPLAQLATPGSRPAEAAIVMHHNFELDLEALAQLAATDIPFIGLLGPARRREELFQLLPEATRASLAPRLRSPVGLELGGRGPEAIALSIAAQLQAWRHDAPPPPR